MPKVEAGKTYDVTTHPNHENYAPSHYRIYKPVISFDTTAIGEVGLTGEIRSVSALNQRLTEVARLGFKKCIIPAHIRGEVKRPEGLELISVKNIREAINAVLG